MNDIKYNYHYDTLGRLIHYKSSDGFESYVNYNDKNQLTKNVHNILGDSKKTLLNYDSYSRLSGELTQNSAQITYKYDALNRLSSQTYEKGSLKLEGKANYVDNYKERTTNILREYVYSVNDQNYLELNYTYDAVGNITVASTNGLRDSKILYFYDSLDQLQSEINIQLAKEISYEYDDGGNITRVSECEINPSTMASSGEFIVQKIYEYADSNWKDKLTKFNGQEITYDEIGNPLQYRDGLSFAWQNGKALASSSKDGANNTYKYDAEGNRIEKTVNGSKTKYFLNDTAIICEDRDGDSPIWYIYDGNGRNTGFEYEGKTYVYLLNAQGDVVEILDECGASVVQYTYDSWGKVVSVEGSLADIIGERNPIRYRGYYYDAETGLYYLNNRYYDPEIGRFINADTTDVLTASMEDPTSDKNLFAYCDNNPVNRADSDGQIWHILAGAAIGGLISGIATVATNIATGSDWYKDLDTAILAGAASGALSAAGLPVGILVAANAGISATESVVNQGRADGFDSIYPREVIFDTAVGAALAPLGRTPKGNANHLMRQGANVTRRVRKTVVKAVKQVPTKGVKQGVISVGTTTIRAGRNYIKQTKKMFYAPLLHPWELTKSFAPSAGIGYVKDGWLFR